MTQKNMLFYLLDKCLIWSQLQFPYRRRWLYIWTARFRLREWTRHSIDGPCDCCRADRKLYRCWARAATDCRSWCAYRWVNKEGEASVWLPNFRCTSSHKHSERWPENVWHYERILFSLERNHYQWSVLIIDFWMAINRNRKLWIRFQARVHDEFADRAWSQWQED